MDVSPTDDAARPAEPPLNERVAEAREALEGGRESTVDYLVGASAEEQPDARAERDPFVDHVKADIATQARDGLRAHLASEAPLAALTKERDGLQEQLDAANRETGEYRRMWEETLAKLDAARGALMQIEHYEHPLGSSIRASFDALQDIARAALGVVAAAEQTTDLGAESAKSADVRATADKEA